ncbi:MAG: hypothetical protein KA100_01805 [Rickettsiales bacterium]|nr:hypothetical protein [Rickettsiales bacterium]
MNKKFLQSVVVGVMGLTLATSCSIFKSESHKCGAKNGCASKKSEASKDASKSEAPKAEKKSKKSKKAKASAEVVKTEEKKN